MEPNQKAFALDLGGEYRSGEASDIPQGKVREARDYVRVGNRLVARPNMVYDALMNYAALIIREDDKNDATRLVAIGAAGAVWAVREKAVASEAWAAAGSGARQARSFASYRGKVYFTTQSYSGPTPEPPLVCDGVQTVEMLTGSTVNAVAVAAAIERVFLGGIQFDITNQFGIANAYDPTAWTRVNLNVSTVSTVGPPATALYSVTPTNNASASMELIGNVALPASAESAAHFLSQLRAPAATQTVPLTLEIIVGTKWTAGMNAMPFDIIRPSVPNGYYYRATTPGIAGGAPPVWPTTIGATVADGGIVWTCEGSEVLGTTEIDLAPHSSTILSSYVSAKVPPGGPNSFVAARIKWGNSATPTGWALEPIDVGFKDGTADTNPSKANFGQQLGSGSYLLPFFNQEFNATAVRDERDMIIWSEIGQPATFLPASYHRVTGVASPRIVELVHAFRRLIAFTQDSIVPFALTASPNYPIQSEQAVGGVGAINPGCVDEIDGRLYFISPNEVYRWAPTMEPEPIAEDAMREAIFARGATWVPTGGSGATAGSKEDARRCLLTIDKKRRLVYVYTQIGSVFIYRIDSREWFTWSLPLSAEVADMRYHPGSGHVYLALWNKGIVRIDAAAVAKDTIDNTATEYSVAPRLTTRGIEAQLPRQTFLVEEWGLHSNNLGDQTGQALLIEYSNDGGTTFTAVGTYTALSGNGKTRNAVSIGQQSENLVLRVTHTGKGGEANWNLTRLDGIVQILGDETPQARPA